MPTNTPETGPEARYAPEPRSKARTEAQRDRDRVLYSTAFRRLSGITQVASPETGQLLHSRLTHTLKVAQIARRMAERLKAEHGDSLPLDPDVVETGALIHDIGHPPFGHIAEGVLDREQAAFEGNAQSFRIVTRLARRSLDYKGLNLTRACLNASLKYPWERTADEGPRHDKWGAYGNDSKKFRWAREELDEQNRDEKTIEAQIMDWADDLTYATHDLEDFYRAGLIPLERLGDFDSKRELGQAAEREGAVRDELGVFLQWILGRDLRTPNKRIAREFGADPEVCEELQGEAEWLFGNLLLPKQPYDGSEASRVTLRETISGLIGDLFEDATLSQDLRQLQVGGEARMRMAILKELTWCYVIERPSLAREQRAQQRVLTELLEIFTEAIRERRWALFPPGIAEILKGEENDDEFKQLAPRILTDYIGGMSEGEVLVTHRALTHARAS